MKLRCAVLLTLGLKGVKIFWNVSKVCMHACSSNGHPNSWSNLNSKKLLESETPSCGFDGVGLIVLLGFGLKELKITLNIMNVAMHTYHPNAHQKIWSNFNSNKFVKSETSSCGFANVGVKRGENSSKRRESWSARLSIKWASKSMIKFQLRENCQKWNFIVHFR